MNSSRPTNVYHSVQRRRGEFPLRLLFAAPALLFLTGSAWALGDVTAFVNSHGNVIIVGDSESNGVYVARTGLPMEILIEGLDRGGGPTTINGEPSVILLASPELFSFDFKDGDDRLHFDSQFPADVKVSGGRGDDWIGFGDPVIGGDLDVDAGSGDDLVDIQDSAVVGYFTVHTGSGADRIQSFFAFFNADTFLDTGPGPDTVDIANSGFDGSLAIDTGADDDEVLLRETEIGGDLEVKLGGGEDSIEMSGNTVDGDTEVKGGKNDDTFINGGGNSLEGRSKIKQFGP